MEYQKALLKIENKLSQHEPKKLTLPHLVPAAVVIPFFEKNNQTHVLFTLRTETVEHHKGQVSFPGGARERQDSTLIDTAVREFYEEVGIPRNLVTIIGELDDFPTVTNFLVTPYVALIPYPFPSKINKKEVDDVLEVPLSLFLSKDNFEEKKWEHKGKKYPVYFYYHNTNVIWGATAFIFNRFIEQVFDFNPASKSVERDPRFDNYLQENCDRKGKLEN
jgi:8-oxo-dGTP pyrophosphatase MutT (NUDIX family)